MNGSPSEQGGNQGAATGQQRTSEQSVAAVVTGTDQQQHAGAVDGRKHKRTTASEAESGSLHESSGWQYPKKTFLRGTDRGNRIDWTH
jgi:hypothetical protein